jgi:hypothetical protein
MKRGFEGTENLRSRCAVTSTVEAMVKFKFVTLSGDLPFDVAELAEQLGPTTRNEIVEQMQKRGAVRDEAGDAVDQALKEGRLRKSGNSIKYVRSERV